MIRSGQRLRSAQTHPEEATYTSAITMRKPKAEKWSSLAVASPAVLLLARSAVTAATVLGLRPGTASVALKQENNHSKGDRGISPPRTLPAKEPNESCQELPFEI